MRLRSRRPAITLGVRAPKVLDASLMAKSDAMNVWPFVTGGKTQKLITRIPDEVLRGKFVPVLAVAEDTDQPLGDDGAQGRSQQKSLDTEIQKPRHGRGGGLLWSVDSTRWPVNAAWIAMFAVSPSRISPTMMTSESWRKKARIAVAKVRPIAGLTCDWLTPEISYSTGSSMVRIFRVGSLRIDSMVASVVVLPLPVGPVIRISPCGSASSRRKADSSRPTNPILLNSSKPRFARQQTDHHALAVLRRHHRECPLRAGSIGLRSSPTIDLRSQDVA